MSWHLGKLSKINKFDLSGLGSSWQRRRKTGKPGNYLRSGMFVIENLRAGVYIRKYLRSGVYIRKNLRSGVYIWESVCSDSGKGGFPQIFETEERICQIFSVVDCLVKT